MWCDQGIEFLLAAGKHRLKDKKSSLGRTKGSCSWLTHLESIWLSPVSVLLEPIWPTQPIWTAQPIALCWGWRCCIFLELRYFGTFQWSYDQVLFSSLVKSRLSLRLNLWL